ncbi:hypothetical protein ACODT5_07510 [Streptomyces sp. 5.8]|uniref:hypothetical protein n=1 Tax=Streptomyces sp. 5.8 TaxID=3406571 RepID=UPI003BB6BD7F
MEPTLTPAAAAYLTPPPRPEVLSSAMAACISDSHLRTLFRPEEPALPFKARRTRHGCTDRFGPGVLGFAHRRRRGRIEEMTRAAERRL